MVRNKDQSQDRSNENRRGSRNDKPANDKLGRESQRDDLRENQGKMEKTTLNKNAPPLKHK